jgi:broad specificity phosphatase PhoE
MTFILGNMLALPSMALFFVVWLLAMVARPFFVACLLLAISSPAAFFKKLTMTVTAIHYLALCNDKKWKKPSVDPESLFRDISTDADADAAAVTTTPCDRKTIVLVRHGESTWNDTFNKGDRSTASFLINFVPGVIKSIAMEWYFFVTGKAQESWFYDSPLSEKGLGQARGLFRFLAEPMDYKTPKEQELIKIMIGEAPSQLLSSNLRRAISTMAVGFQARLQKKIEGDSIMVLSELQEISRNPDALTVLNGKGSEIYSAWTDPPFLADIFKNQTDTSLHAGNKPINSNGLKRMQAFCDLIFSDSIQKDAVVVAGHSLWFRSFFQTYMPHTVEHIAKKKKLVNGACVGLVLMRVKTKDGTFQYMIDPKSITVLYGGF